MVEVEDERFHLGESLAIFHPCSLWTSHWWRWRTPSSGGQHRRRPRDWNHVSFNFQSLYHRSLSLDKQKAILFKTPGLLLQPKEVRNMNVKQSIKNKDWSKPKAQPPTHPTQLHQLTFPFQRMLLTSEMLPSLAGKIIAWWSCVLMGEALSLTFSQLKLSTSSVPPGLRPTAAPSGCSGLSETDRLNLYSKPGRLWNCYSCSLQKQV